MVAEHEDMLDEETVEAILGGKVGDAVGPALHGSPRSESPAPRVCRICFSDEITPPDRLLSPCRCKGTMKYVHSSCLDQWRSSSRRNDSAVACDQCGTPYRLRHSLLVRVLSSRVPVVPLSVCMFIFLVWSTGALVSLLLRRCQPHLFQGTHPYVQQSLAYPAIAAAEHPWGTPPDEGTSGLHFGAIGAAWEYVVTLAEVDDENPANAWDIDAPAPSAGVFQPSVLVQLVQGMIQRLLQAACHAHYPVAISPPFSWTDLLIWHVSLGLAVLGTLSMFNVLLAVSVLVPFHMALPLGAGRTERATSAALDALLEQERNWPQVPLSRLELLQLTWQTINMTGMAILAVVAVGILRVFAIISRLISATLHVLLANMHELVLDYDASAEEPRRAPARPASAGRAPHERPRFGDARWMWLLGPA